MESFCKKRTTIGKTQQISSITPSQKQERRTLQVQKHHAVVSTTTK